ncbi:Major facilitator superfamily domain general substrate transporter protein [Diaporthe amygdali]|uniref:Major facilitator superfamily domain general substrate transporter protein n=1 Tax=Phomopsis amygdali TaxID=1214568 RepID=UPI0022FDB62D|nr:Major facilitator superfamily domain general substrate transporter protein [Diaporthe amygdali]KAJ0124030.1 Major facilitator superfamily domain general substrate transporter protein [Diaporthe amygdali]
MRHGFFADMGVFTLRTRDNVRFFPDTKCIKWMLECRAISAVPFEQWCLLDSRTIKVLNKSDTFVRILAVGQALWFCINITARGTQRLAVTTLKVTTIGLIVDSVLVYYVWKDKPSNVELSIIIELEMTLDELLLLEEDEESRSRPYFRTPLDFTSRKVWSFYLIYH